MSWFAILVSALSCIFVFDVMRLCISSFARACIRAFVDACVCTIVRSVVRSFVRLSLVRSVSDSEFEASSPRASTLELRGCCPILSKIFPTKVYHMSIFVYRSSPIWSKIFFEDPSREGKEIPRRHRKQHLEHISFTPGARKSLGK